MNTFLFAIAVIITALIVWKARGAVYPEVKFRRLFGFEASHLEHDFGDRRAFLKLMEFAENIKRVTDEARNDKGRSFQSLRKWLHERKFNEAVRIVNRLDPDLGRTLPPWIALAEYAEKRRKEAA